jgi:hypothetical protein
MSDPVNAPEPHAADKIKVPAKREQAKRRAKKPAKTKKVSTADEGADYPIVLDSDLERELIVDCCRFAEGLLTESAVRKKFHFDERAWVALARNEPLIEKIESEKLRRMRDGSTKREKAQLHVMRAPDVLSGILNDNTANARHRIDSAKTLNEFAANGPAGSAADASRFIITINLGAESTTYNKSIKPLEPGELDPHDITPDSVDTNVLAAIAAREPTESGGGDNTL